MWKWQMLEQFSGYCWLEWRWLCSSYSYAVISQWDGCVSVWLLLRWNRLNYQRIWEKWILSQLQFCKLRHQNRCKCDVYSTWQLNTVFTFFVRGVCMYVFTVAFVLVEKMPACSTLATGFCLIVQCIFLIYSYLFTVYIWITCCSPFTISPRLFSVSFYHFSIIRITFQWETIHEIQPNPLWG